MLLCAVEPIEFGMNFHRSGAERERFDPDAHNLKHAVHHAFLSPAIHAHIAHIDRVPADEALRKAAPCSPVRPHTNRVQHLKVGQT